ncbi:unnamed protein product [Coffea canephora]|uniref:Uncharacterized protein n=1 Tax=Coffea canephora TaxID=49390 RepID=A0A068UP56_COFCA|nr:unnamed protein product [Coffea canephora]
MFMWLMCYMLYPLFLGFLHLNIMFVCYMLCVLMCLYVLIYTLFVLLYILKMHNVTTLVQR